MKFNCISDVLKFNFLVVVKYYTNELSGYVKRLETGILVHFVKCFV